MKIKIILPLILVAFCSALTAQDEFRVVDILNKGRSSDEKKMLVIKQDARIDTIINRHILANARKEGVVGWRIQIYRGGHRTAQEEAHKVRASFMNDFADIPADLVFDKPNWFKVKVGYFRSREEAAIFFYKILEKYPDAYLIKERIRLTNAGR